MTQSLSRGVGVDYPDLAVKLIFAGCAYARTMKHILLFQLCYLAFVALYNEPDYAFVALCPGFRDCGFPCPA